MVFAPTRDLSPKAHEPATAPRRRDHVSPPTVADGGRRLAWRAVVHMQDGQTVKTSWHLVGCTAPQEHAAHCPVGQHLLETTGEPDGHCLIEGSCARCS